ncbi:sporulation related protein [Motilibacter peucedani]|uniref:Sporulation related protein n=1 Tax=Motilibacter peucedani TaxID=598650 RepID=A0A420XUX4_9ACTN|nr:phosphodiester glycosidase family protein [Motilibacter peucedani]RKS80540.1 sporulation related protein [Motilibacter peucedani]
MANRVRRVLARALPVALVASSAAVGSLTGLPTGSAAPSGLPLGAAGLPETRTTRTVQAGVTVTTITRGRPGATDSWTLEVAVPSDSTDPDAPATALAPQPEAQALADRLQAAGLPARAERVTTPALADFTGGTIGWRVRVGSFPTKEAAELVRPQVLAAGASASSVYTGWDGDQPDEGPWHLQVVTIDPRTFSGRLEATVGPDVHDRETTSALARAAGATVATNAGYFVLDPASGAPGDPAGAGVYDGQVLSEPITGRPALVLRDDARGTRIERLHWSGTARGEQTLALDGIDRVPGLIRNCGGTPDDLSPAGVPTATPLHDTTCTDADEVVAFTSGYAATTPAGPGLEAVLDAHQRVVALRSPRGGSLPAGGYSVQATGSDVAALRSAVRVGHRLRITTKLLDEDGDVVRHSAGTSVVNGGPMLVRSGALDVTATADGFDHPGDPSWFYGFSAKRNPRTFAGTDAQGRTVLVTADGRSTSSLGLSLHETAQVAQALGLREAMNLDGGGSTTAVVDGQVVNSPSDATGERPVGDALLVLPR